MQFSLSLCDEDLLLILLIFHKDFSLLDQLVFLLNCSIHNVINCLNPVLHLIDYASDLRFYELHHLIARDSLSRIDVFLPGISKSVCEVAGNCSSKFRFVSLRGFLLDKFRVV